MTTFEMCKKLIKNGRYKKADMIGKLDVLLLGDRITQKEYNELVRLMK